MLLNKIRSPRDLKKLKKQKLEELVREIRAFLILNVSKTGGHLASNLGVVELTVALHRFLDCPRDQLIWDVGHQCYTHKILTGRRRQFCSLRQKGGLSGFPKREESVYDSFGAGHASTSLSAAIGMAEAFKKHGEKRRVVAVIGDGALTGGMALEALNQVGYLGSKVIIILNDNRMSISENVGALSRYTKRIEKTITYQRVKEEIDELLVMRNSGNGEFLKRISSLKKSLKQVGTPGLLFEKLGVNYIGPVDGHSLSSLEKALKKADKIKGPVLIHARTKKGMGYEPAEKAADHFHGISPFCVKTGELLGKNSSGRTFSDYFGKKLLDLARYDKKIVAITAAMPEGTGVSFMANELQDQFYDVGISEQHAVTFAAGLATQGLKPVVAIYSTFIQRAYDQIIHDVCLQKLPVVFALDRAGLVGEDGPTHHGVFDLSFLRPIPNLTILAPKDGPELERMLEFALKLKAPVVIRYPRGSGEPIAFSSKRESLVKVIKMGRAERILKGRKQVVVSVGSEFEKAMAYALRQKIKPIFFNARFVKPVDPLIIKEIARIKRAIIFEENVTAGGFGSAILEALAKKGIKAEVELKGIAEGFCDQGTREELKKIYLK